MRRPFTFAGIAVATVAAAVLPAWSLDGPDRADLGADASVGTSAGGAGASVRASAELGALAGQVLRGAEDAAGGLTDEGSAIRGRRERTSGIRTVALPDVVGQPPATPSRPEPGDRQEPTRPGDDERPPKVEPMRLHCAERAPAGDPKDPSDPSVSSDDVARHDPAVVCGWSQARHPMAAGYQLWRGTRDARPTVIFSTGDLEERFHVDEDVVDGDVYLYVVEAVAADGTVVGRSNPSRVAPGASPREPLIVGRAG